MKYALWIITVLAACAAQAQRGQQGPTAVIVSTVQQRAFADKVEALGTTKANETVVITADTSEKVSGIHFEDGQEVQKGDLLVTLDKLEEDAQFRAAEAARIEAQSAYDRAKNLEETSALSKATVQQRLADLRQARAAAEAIDARLNELAIRAPFDGVLGLRQVSVGALVRPGDAITTIDDLNQIKVDFDVPSIYLATLQSGLPIIGTVDAYGDRAFKGRVATVDTQVDPVTRTVTVRAILPNPDRALKPGLLMSIELLKNEREALLIPEEALVKRGEKNFVFVTENRDGKLIANEREIKLGERQPGVIEVRSGLTEGEQVVAHGTVKIRSGAEITIRATENEDMPLKELLEQQQPGKAS
ncbi:MAG: efflux RND transporter periplasmic adaptor subunit [Alphaproteobacteria bacterium]